MPRPTLTSLPAQLAKSFCSAFLMYSRIPMPQVEWKEENRRYALCFFPLIGLVTGTLLMALFWLGQRLGMGELLFAVLAVALPLLVTGGIHLDGFCDVQDAQASWGSREKLLSILADPHIGSFAAIRLGAYLLLLAGLYAEAARFSSPRLMAVCALGFVQSRSLSGLGAVTLKAAKTGGTLQSFAHPAHRQATVAVTALFLAASLGSMVALCPLPGLCGGLCGALAFLRYRRLAYRRFGGITGDLAGYFLCLCELAVPAGAVAGAFLVCL